MHKMSAGILAWSVEDNTVKVLLVHLGGPFFAKKDLGAWSIPKGEYDDGEDALTAARREFAEELGTDINGDFVSLGSTKLKSGKVVHAWAVASSFDSSNFRSNTFSIEWPPRSGKMTDFPEVDKAEWVTLEKARELLHPAQVVFLDRFGDMRSSKDGHSEDIL